MASNRRKMTSEKNVICSASETDTLIEFYRNVLNEVKNLCCGLPFVTMRFFTSFRMTGRRARMTGGGRGRMTDGRFVIGSPGHGINPLQKRVMTKQVAVIANCEVRSRKQSRLSRLYLDCFVPRNDGVTSFVIISL